MGKECFTQKWLESSSPNPTTTDGQRPHDEGEEGFAARLYSSCRSVLGDLCSCEQGSLYSRSLQPHLLREELAELYLWGHGFGPGELDTALDYSDDARYLVLDALADIGQSLLWEVSCLSESALKLVRSQKSQELKDLIEQTKIITANRGRDEEEASSDGDGGGGGDDDDDDGDDDDDDDENGDDETEEDNTTDGVQMGDLVDLLKTQIGYLRELGPTLQQNLLHARKSCAKSSYPPVVPFRLSDPAAIYVSLVRDKFRNAQAQLVNRLGEANWQRHQTIREQLKRPPIEDDVAIDEDQDLLYSVFRPHTTFHDSGVGTSVPTHTDHAPSHASFQSSKVEGEHGSVRVPPTPEKVKEGKPFQCPFCGQIISNIRNRIDWKMHVFADLHPYICTFAKCEMELAQFPTRLAWADHEFSEHRVIRWWECFECTKQCHSETEWREHLEYFHKRTFIGAKYHVAEKSASKKRAKAAESEQCPLCQVTLGKSRRDFVKHVGRHMEEIALVALPREVDEEPDAHSRSTGSKLSSIQISSVSRSDDGETDLHFKSGWANLPSWLDKQQEMPVAGLLSVAASVLSRDNDDTSESRKAMKASGLFSNLPLVPPSLLYNDGKREDTSQVKARTPTDRRESMDSKEPISPRKSMNLRESKYSKKPTYSRESTHSRGSTYPSESAYPRESTYPGDLMYPLEPIYPTEPVNPIRKSISPEPVNPIRQRISPEQMEAMEANASIPLEVWFAKQRERSERRKSVERREANEANQASEADEADEADEERTARQRSQREVLKKLQQRVAEHKDRIAAMNVRGKRESNEAHEARIAKEVKEMEAREKQDKYEKKEKKEARLRYVSRRSCESCCSMHRRCIHIYDEEVTFADGSLLRRVPTYPLPTDESQLPRIKGTQK